MSDLGEAQGASNCGNCTYYKVGPSTLNGNGFCRFNAPSPSNTAATATPQARWPVVEPTNWCGSHKPTVVA